MDSAQAGLRTSSKSPKPKDLGALKALSYDDVPERTPPLVVSSIHQSRPPSSPRFLPKSPRGLTSPKRPRTSPAPRADRNSHLSQDLKRDSGFAPSLSTTGRASYADSHQDAPGLERIPSLPTIEAQDDEEARQTRTKSPFSRKRAKSKNRQKKIDAQAREEQQQKELPAVPRSRSHSPPPIRRTGSFKGIDTAIPSGDTDWQDLTSDSFGFSNRGSIMFGGKRMAELFMSAPKESARHRPQDVSLAQMEEQQESEQLQSSNHEVPDKGAEKQVEQEGDKASETRDEHLPTQQAAQQAKQNNEQHDDQHTEQHVDKRTIPTVTHDPSPIADGADGDNSGKEKIKGGLVSGRRKPSVHMLQAAIHGGRVLSAEEITFSLRVRSMYEHGDERAADWIKLQDVQSGRLSPDLSVRRGAPAPDITIDHVIEDKTTPPAEHAEEAQHPALRPVSPGPTSPGIRASYMRDAHEIAGGIEDWQDIDGQDVDRYGFIRPNRVSSSHSGPPSDGVQRVATALKFEADQPRGHRRLRRKASVARSSRSVPAANRRPASLNGTITSVQTAGSARGSTRRSMFRTRDQKIMEEAGDMLHLPAGYQDLDEKHEQNKSEDTLRRRERAREEKWRSMAHDVSHPAPNRGGERLYEFNVNDPKVVNRTWKGIPDKWRATAWHSFLTTSAKRRSNYVPDEKLVETFHELQEQNSADDVQIDMDVPRTINLHIMFRRRYRGGQRLLFRVLHAISLYSPETGYVQGMASLAATLLCYYDEERAFVMMVRLWQLRGLARLFQPGFEGLMAALADFEKNWLRGGEVAQKLDELGVTSMTYGTRWYLTLFNLSIPFPAQLRVWDVFMLLGDAAPGTAEGEPSFDGADLDVLHAASAALIDATREVVLDADFENVMKVLTSFIPVKDEDILMRVMRAEWKMRKKRAGA